MQLATFHSNPATRLRMDLDPRLRIWPIGPEGQTELRRQDRALLRLVAGGGLLLALLWMV